MEKEYLSIPELAKLLGISRMAVYKQVKSGKIQAIRIGRNYAIKLDSVNQVLGKKLTEKGKNLVQKSISKVINDYGETLKLLGKEN